MTKLFSTDPSTGRSAYITEVAIGLALLALVIMIIDAVAHWGDDTQFLGLAQVALSLTCLVIGGIYLFRTHPAAGEDDGTVIDLRDEQRAPEPTEAPRQVPDARSTRVFAG